MSKGRKAVVHNNSDWESVFYNSVGTYVQYINLKLAEQIKSEPLSNHIRIAGGYAFKSSQYKKQGVPVIRISDFSNERIVLDDVVYYEESEALERYELHAGDIVIALTGGTIAKLGIVQKGIGKLYLNQRVGKFEVLNPDEFENEYVYWIARSVQSIIKNLAWGAAIPNVSPKQIEELQFPIPDKETQNGIIDFLNDLRANKIEEDKEYFNSEVEDFIYSLQVNQISGAELKSELIYQQGLVRQVRKALLTQAIQGKLVEQDHKDGNAFDLLKKIKAERKKLKNEKEFSPIMEEEIPFDIPKNWVWCRLGEISHIASGSTPSKDSFVSQGIPYLKMYNLKNQKIDFDYKPQFIKEEIHNGQLKRSRTQIGDVIMNIVGPPLGKLAIIPESLPEANFNQAGVLIRPYLFKEINKWIYYYLNEMSEIDSISTKGVAGQDNISITQSNNIKISLPPIQEQRRIIIKLEKVMTLCDELFESINQSEIEIENLIKTLLNAALGITTKYDVTKDKTLKRKILRFYNDGNTFETINMNIIEILKTSPLPISATVVWNSSKYSNDIESFYAELKRLIDIEKFVIEEKQGKESFLKLASNEN